MDGLVEALEWVTLFAFTGLAILAVLLWARQRNAPSKWLALTFLVLAIIVIAGRVTPDTGTPDEIEWLTKVEIAILLLFPYFLYRFGASFRRPSTTIEIIAAILTIGLIVWTFLLPDLPAEGDPRNAAFTAYVIALLIQWSTLSLLVTWWLWRAGRDQPEVARRRMRLLGAAAGLLSFALIIAGAGSGGDPNRGLQVFVSLLTLVSATLFYLGFAPPVMVRVVWRRQSEEALRRAVSQLLSAQTEEEVTRGLLPHVAAIVGGAAVALLDADGNIIDSYQADESMTGGLENLVGGTAPDGSHQVREGVLRLLFPFGSLVVWSSPYTPFFGEDDVELLRSLGTLAHLALERTRATTLRARLAEAQLRREKALEINDNVVQGLAIAKYAFDLERLDQARQAINDTLAAARAIISSLLEEIAPGEEIKPGALVRGQPASVPRVDPASSRLDS